MARSDDPEGLPLLPTDRHFTRILGKFSCRDDDDDDAEKFPVMISTGARTVTKWIFDWRCIKSTSKMG